MMNWNKIEKCSVSRVAMKHALEACKTDLSDGNSSVYLVLNVFCDNSGILLWGKDTGVVKPEMV